MATIANEYDPNDPNNGNSGGASGTSIESAGGGDASGQANTAVAGGGGITAPRTPSGAPNIQQYMQANQGAGQQLQSGIENNFQNQANQVNQGVNNSQNQLNTQADQNKLGNLDASQQANTIGTAFKDPQALLNAYNQGKSSTSQQPVHTENSDAYNNFNMLNTGGYNPGIQNYSATEQNQYGALQNQLAGLAQQSNNAGNELGRSQLLQNTVGRNGYNQGQQTLDNLFLQTQPGIANNLQANLKNITNQTGAGVNQFDQNAQAKIQALTGLANQGQTAINSLFTNGLPQATTGNQVLDQINQNYGGQNLTGLNQIGSNVNNEYANAQAQNTLGQGLAASAKSPGSLTPDQLAAMGLTAGTQTWGINDLTPYLNTNTLNQFDQGGAAQAATPEEFARYNALNQLAGGANGLQTSIFGGAQTAGGYSPYAFNQDKFNTDVNSRKNAILGADFNNAASAAATGLRNVSHGGYTNSMTNDLASQIQNAKTPEEAQQAIQAYQAYYANGQNGQPGYYDYAFDPFTQYYNNEYTPNSASILGQAATPKAPGTGK